MADSLLHMVKKYSRFRSMTLFGVELPHPLQMNIQLRKLNLLIQHFKILQLRHTLFITQSLKEIHSGRETGLIDTGPLHYAFTLLITYMYVKGGLQDFWKGLICIEVRGFVLLVLSHFFFNIKCK